MQFKDLFLVSNLFSISRVLLLFFIGFYLARQDNMSSVICLGIMAVASLTDVLDGYFARKLNQVSRLGLILDPLADKLFAIGLIILLIMFRNFPVWLAGVIVGRDLLIMLAAVFLLKGRDIVIPSNLTGKYTFAIIVVLLSSYIVRFEFGIILMTLLTILFTVLSLIIYLNIYKKMLKGQSLNQPVDKPLYKKIRITVTLIIAVYFLYRFYFHFIGLF